MQKIVPVMLVASLFAVSQLVAARGGGGGPAGGGGPPSSGPPSHSAGAANSNGRFSSDRDHGLDRAEDRRSAQGNAHEKATVAAKKARTKVRDADDIVRR